MLRNLLILLAAVSFPFPGAVRAESGDAAIQYSLGMAAWTAGDDAAAYDRFKKACMASDGLSDACLAWAEMAEASDNDKHVRRALSSAVVLNPEDVRARYRFAGYMLRKRDFVWAIESLNAALEHATRDDNRALIGYYLGYAYYKNGAADTAKQRFEDAVSSGALPAEIEQRCRFYLGLIAMQGGDRDAAIPAMVAVSEGPEGEWRDAADKVLAARSTFPFSPGRQARISMGHGVNSHPTSAFVDETPSRSSWVYQLLLRGDGLWTTGTRKNRFKSTITALREQAWISLDRNGSPESGHGDTDPAGNTFAPGDLNLSLFLGQLAFARNVWRGPFEHLLLIGIDGETQLLDRVPEKTDGGQFVPGAFGLYTWAAAAKLWWSISRQRDSVYEVRLRAELRPNLLDENRSTSRYRVRWVHSRWFFERALQLRLLAGIRYDRTFSDPAVVKYDRLVPEGEAVLDWQTPFPRVSATLGGKLKYNWYMNAAYDEKNSFRATWQDDIFESVAQNEIDRAAYYNALSRQDLEWEIFMEAAVRLDEHSQMALTYKHHSRTSNIDDDELPDHFIGDGPRYGYRQHVATVELRADF